MEAIGPSGGSVANDILLQLARTQHARTALSNRLATGLRVTSAADDPSGYVIATTLQTRVSSLDAASENTQNAVNYINVATGALQSMISLVQRMRTLAIAADNSVLSTSDRQNLQDEVTQLVAQINAISANTNFNGNRVFPDPNQPLAAPSIGGNGFETPVVSSGFFGAFQYNPGGTPWTFTAAHVVAGSPAGSGVTGNNSGFTSGAPNAPVGAQAAFLQGRSTISQTISGFADEASYTFSFFAAARRNLGGNQDFTVSLDGTTIGTYHIPIDGSYHAATTAAVVPGSGNHTLTFRGLDTAGNDNTVFIDDVQATAQDLRPTQALIIHSSAAEGDIQTVQVKHVNAAQLGVAGIDLTQGNAGNPAGGPNLAIGLADTALTTLTTFAAQLGAASNALSDTQNDNNLAALNTQAAESTIRDLNVANAVAENVRLQLISSLQTSVLAQHNTQAADILALFR